MATRRIARGRGGSPVPIIVLSVIVVGLLASTIVLGMKVSDLQDDLLRSQRDTKKEQDRFEKAVQLGLDYKNVVGLDYEAADADYKKLEKELEKTAALQGEDRSQPPGNMKNLARRYADRCKLLEAEVRKHLGEIKTAKADISDLKKQSDALRDSKREEADAASVKHATLQGEKEQVESTLQETTRTLSGQIDKLKAEKRALQTKVTTIEKELNLKARTVVEKDELIDKLRHPPKPKYTLVPPGRETIDGKVLTVEADGEYVMIDLGRRDWVSEGMEFRVFDETNPDARKEKGRIQVRRVYDTISQAKILQQEAMDPILRDMVIINPAFSRGRQLKFVLEGRFIEPNLERLLGRYPCAIAKKVSRETDKLVIGEAERKPGDPHWKESENYKLAEDLRIDILMERDLLRYLGAR